MPLVHSHTIGASGNWLRGAVAFLFVWGLGQFIGPLSPLLLLASGAMLPCCAVLTRTSRGLRTVYTGHAYQPPAWCMYQRRRAACLEAPRTGCAYVPKVPCSLAPQVVGHLRIDRAARLPLPGARGVAVLASLLPLQPEHGRLAQGRKYAVDH